MTPAGVTNHLVRKSVSIEVDTIAFLNDCVDVEGSRAPFQGCHLVVNPAVGSVERTGSNMWPAEPSGLPCVRDVRSLGLISFVIELVMV